MFDLTSRTRFGSILTIAAFALAVSRSDVALGVGSTSKASEFGQAGRLRPIIDFATLPLSFEMNQGQADPQVKFLSRANGYTLYLCSTESVMTLAGKADSAQHQNERTAHVVRTRLAGSNPKPRVVGIEKLPGNANYFIGNDPAKWRTEIPTFAKVKYENVYPGIDLVYYGNQGRQEHDFVIAVGADPKVIQMTFHGVDKLETDSEGDLVLQTAAGKLLLGAPQVYQEVDGKRRPITGAYTVSGRSSQTVVRFSVGQYDASKTLVIDPATLFYSTYMGGGSNEFANAIGVDASGNTYVAGRTMSQEFFHTFPPVPNPASDNVFVIKLSSTPDALTGTRLLYSSVLGGSSFDGANGIAVTAAGAVYVTGTTRSGDFPVANAFQPTKGSFFFDDAFVAKLNGTGSLIYSTFLGGSNTDLGVAVATRNENEVYVAGETTSIDFPIRGSAVFQRVRGGGSVSDAFVAKIRDVSSRRDAAGNLITVVSLLNSTYLGGSNTDRATGIAVDSQNQPHVTGETQSTDFPTVNRFQTAQGRSDVFVTKLLANFGSLFYSTYLGGSFDDDSSGIALDSSGNAWVAGFTNSGGSFPLQGPFQNQQRGLAAFVTGLGPNGGSPILSTFLDGSGSDVANAIAVSGSGVYVTGSTNSPSSPAHDPHDPLDSLLHPTVPPLLPDLAPVDLVFNEPVDAFVAQIFPRSTKVICINNVCRTLVSPTIMGFSTYLGGGRNDFGQGIAVDTSGNIYVTGNTASSNFPSRNAPFRFNNGGSDIFVTKIGGVSNLRTGTFDLSPTNATVSIHDRLNYAFAWTVPSSLNWHDLQSLQLRIRDGRESILSLLFEEATNTFSLFDEATGQYEGSFVPGSEQRLKTPQATLYLAQTSVVGTGAAGSSVTLNLSLSFKPKAAGHTFVVEVAASDDLDNLDDFVQAGTVTVTRDHDDNHDDDHGDDHGNDHGDDHDDDHRDHHH